jgi:hypothetical protein
MPIYIIVAAWFGMFEYFGCRGLGFVESPVATDFADWVRMPLV